MKQKLTALSLILAAILGIISPGVLAEFVNPDGTVLDSQADHVYGDDSVLEDILMTYQFVVSVGTIDLDDGTEQIFDLTADVYDTNDNSLVSDDDKEEYLQWTEAMAYAESVLLYETADSDTLEPIYSFANGLAGMEYENDEGEMVEMPLNAQYIIQGAWNAILSGEKSPYTVTIKDSDTDETLTEYENIRYGTHLEDILETPSKASDSTYSYEFSGWAESDLPLFVTDDLTLTAQWTKTALPSGPVTGQVYQLYLDAGQSETDGTSGTEADGTYSAQRGGTVNTVLYLKSTQAVTLEAFEIHIHTPDGVTFGTITPADEKIKLLDTGTKKLTDTDAYLQFALKDAFTLSADTPLKLADIPFALSADSVYGTVYDITIDAVLSVSDTPEPVPDSEITIDSFKLKDTAPYKITFKNGDTIVSTVEYLPGDTSVTVPEVPEKAGYTGVWGSYDLTKTEDQTVEITYTPVSYKITYTGDFTNMDAEQAYTIESADKVYTPSERDGMIFSGWQVVETVGNWTADEVIPAGTVLTGKYGSVTLKAVWESLFVLEDYRYANTGDKLLIVHGGLDAGKTYAYDGVPMYRTTDSAYTGVFTGAEEVYVYIVSAEDDTASKLSVIDGAAEEIRRNGEINKTSGVDIADANAVYQMLQKQDCYTYEQLDIRSRLEADMSTATDNVTYRGSIEDAAAILNLLNGVS